MEMELDGIKKRNGRISYDFGEFKLRNIKEVNNILTCIFGKTINLRKECKKEQIHGIFAVHIDIIVQTRVKVMLCICQEPEEYINDDFCRVIVRKELSFSKFKYLLCRILYYDRIRYNNSGNRSNVQENPFSHADIRGSYGTLSDMPLTAIYLANYINKGIRYCDKERFYRRDRLIKSICYPT
jgi:hypothetical protein